MTGQRFIVDGLARMPQFSHGGWAGDVLHVAGTLGTTEGMTLADGVGAQTTAALNNMHTILQHGGLDWHDVAKIDVFLADMIDSADYNQAYGEYFASRLDPPPARITVGGAQLALDARIEMQCVASRQVSLAQSTPRPRPRRRTMTVEHDGEELYIEVLGEGGVPMVLSHGLGGNHAVWIHQAAHFARDRMVVVWDHRGFGRSTDRADASGPQVAAGDLLAICDHLEITQADLIGQSMGGWTVIGAALARADLARSIVLADSLAGFTSDAISAAMDTDAASSPVIPDGLGEHRALDPSFTDRDPAHALLYQQLGGMGSIDPAVMIPRILGETHDQAQASRVTCPVLCLVGDRDPLFPPAAIRAMADMLPNARFTEIAGSGHSPYFEDPQAWNIIVERFLATI